MYIYIYIYIYLFSFVRVVVCLPKFNVCSCCVWRNMYEPETIMYCISVRFRVFPKPRNKVLNVRTEGPLTYWYACTQFLTWLYKCVHTYIHIAICIHKGTNMHTHRIIVVSVSIHLTLSGNHDSVCWGVCHTPQWLSSCYLRLIFQGLA